MKKINYMILYDKFVHNSVDKFNLDQENYLSFKIIVKSKFRL